MPEIRLELASEDVRKLDTEVDLLGFEDLEEYLRWIIGNRAAIEQGTERDQLLTEYQARVDELEAELDEQGREAEAETAQTRTEEAVEANASTDRTTAASNASSESSEQSADRAQSADGSEPAAAGDRARATDGSGTVASSAPESESATPDAFDDASPARTEQTTFAATPSTTTADDASNDARTDASNDARTDSSGADRADSSDVASNAAASTVPQTESTASEGSESEPEPVAETAASGNSVAATAGLDGNFAPERVERFEDESLGSHANQLRGVEGERLDEFARRAVAKTRERLGREPTTGLEYRSGTRIARSSSDVRPGEDLVDLDSLDVPGRSAETRAPRQEAVGAALAYLRDVSRAKRSDFVDELYDEYDAGYDSESGWWRCIKRGLKDASVVEGGDGSRVWRYRPPGSREGELVGAGPKRVVDPD